MKRVQGQGLKQEEENIVPGIGKFSTDCGIEPKEPYCSTIPVLRKVLLDLKQKLNDELDRLITPGIIE